MGKQSGGNVPLQRAKIEARSPDLDDSKAAVLDSPRSGIRESRLGLRPASGWPVVFVESAADGVLPFCILIQFTYRKPRGVRIDSHGTGVHETQPGGLR